MADQPTATDLDDFEKEAEKLRDLATWAEKFRWIGTKQKLLAAAASIDFVVRYQRKFGVPTPYEQSFES